MQAARILFVDDDEGFLKAVERGLRKRFQVQVASSGLEGLKLISESGPFAVVVTDFRMASMDGAEFLSAVARQSPESIRVMLTGYTDLEAAVRAVNVGHVFQFLTKPCPREGLAAAMSAAIEQHRLIVAERELLRQLRRRNRRLKQLEALRDDLTHMIVHDMKSPLQGVSGYLELLLMHAKLNEKELSLVNRARNSLAVVLDLAGSLLDLGRLESREFPLEKEGCSLRKLADEALGEMGFLAELSQVEVRLAARSSPAFAPCDPEIILRVFRNLLANAIRSTPQGRCVVVQTRSSKSQAMASVKDRGPGVPLRDRRLIFEKFRRSPAAKRLAHSSGIGLAFCKCAVEAHGGKIGVRSRPGGGSIFWFGLPTDKGRFQSAAAKDR